MRRFLIGAAAIVCTVILGTAPAFGASASISVSPSTVSARSTVHISGSIPVNKCPASDGATVTGDAALFPPDGFGPTATRDGSGDFALDYVVPTSTPAGTYSVGLRCGGGNVGVSASLTVAPGGGPETGAGGTAGHSSSSWMVLGASCLVLAGLVLALRRRISGRKS